ncbi:MAG: ribonuclease Y [Candidatus Magasanikbacteria bacterium CG_4_9_14_3_um_filter_32_9]|uniref:Ribonuclease Y n=1 Tax=Candidatus Magasanikbacteria bacterium CG_4_9_14_3_um_filter_32_9 TaxID=1974644 RepID=A0A2M7Z5X7_9BACT|nr:MAG: ribonuclease Y [Candidatus Magasanikbacteria bacterium CG_4_9_14_3_um_filter_32_9]
MSLITLFFVSVISIVLGVAIGYVIRKLVAQARINTAEIKAETILSEVKNKEKSILIEAREKGIKIIDEAKKEENQRRKEIRDLQNRISQRESMFDKKLLDFESQKSGLQQKKEEIENIKQKISGAYDEAMKKLQKISKYSTEQAKEELMESVAKDASHDLAGRIMKLEKQNTEVYEEKARGIILGAIQRCSSNHASETTSTVVTLPSDDMKGRIIGKDGRNIKTIEKLTGCELVIDETPGVILISGFSPIRRRVCYLALEKMIQEGVIHPGKIEQSIEDSKKELALDIKKTGEETLYKLGFTGIDPKLVSIVGRLKYRTSYGQNVLNHSIEVAYLSALMAEELGGIDPIKAKKAGFFHDIGKAVDQETQGTHPEIGFTILKKFGLDEDVQDAAANHHEDKPERLITQLVKAADAISSSRVGARRDTYEKYVARLEELEQTAGDFPGIEKVYAIQAGREVRIFVKPSEIDDYQAYNLAKDIARKIEGELQYPGEIKVTVLRETRVIEYAK